MKEGGEGSMQKYYGKVLLIVCMLLLSACERTAGTKVAQQATSSVSLSFETPEIYIKGITHNAERPLKKGDTVRITVEVEHYNPAIPLAKSSTIVARIANQPGEILLRNDGTLGDIMADDNFFEGEYRVGEESNPVVNGKIIVNSFRQQMVCDKRITIEP